MTSLCLLYILYVFILLFIFMSCLWLWLISFQIILVFFIPIHYIFKMFFIFGCTGLFVTYGRQGLLSTCSARASHSNAFSCYRVWALCLCTVVVTPKLWNTELWPTGLVSPTYVGTSQMRDGTLVSCVNYQVDSLPLSQKGGPKTCSLTCILEPMNWVS